MQCKRWQLFLLVFSGPACNPAHSPAMQAVRAFRFSSSVPIHPVQALDSHAPMNSFEDTDQRLTALEIKASYSDDLLEQLNLLVYRQQLQIDALVQQLQQMHRQLPEAGSGRRYGSTCKTSLTWFLLGGWKNRRKILPCLYRPMPPRNGNILFRKIWCW